jgi:hypothetical protein
MNEMVNLIPTCIVSSKRILFQNDSSQFWKNNVYTCIEGEEEGGGDMENMEER